MSYLNKVSSAILGLGQAANNVGKVGANIATWEFINAAKSTLEGVQEEMNTLYGKRTVAEGSRDALLMAIAGTSEGRGLDITRPDEVLPQAMTVIRTMDADIRTMREAEEIPFGAVEQDYDKMQLAQRVAELELLLELKVDECIAIDNQLREFKAQWLSIINYINNIAPGELNGVEPLNLRNGAAVEVVKSSSHELKILPEFFNAVISGHKKAEIRKADRLFSAGDELWLREWTVQDGYTGRDVYRVITHVTDLMGYAPGYVMLSIEDEIIGATL
jgi:hypothetical protein